MIQYSAIKSIATYNFPALNIYGLGGCVKGLIAVLAEKLLKKGVVGCVEIQFCFSCHPYFTGWRKQAKFNRSCCLASGQ